MSNIYIFGHKGWIGNYLLKYFKALPLGMHIPKDCSFSTFMKELNKVVKINKKDVIINCVGKINGSSDELHFANVIIPLYLANFSKEQNIKLIHLGSCAEYTRVDGKIFYNEEDQVGSTTDYGNTKNLGSQEILRNNHNALILRLFNLYDTVVPLNNTLFDILSRVKLAYFDNKLCVELDHVAFRDFINLTQLSQAIQFCIVKDFTGILNICSSLPIAYHEIALEIQKNYGSIIEVDFKDKGKIEYVVGSNKKWLSLGGMNFQSSADIIAKTIVERCL
jgi:nucleoside-diphosphate-sugar epimerase